MRSGRDVRAGRTGDASGAHGQPGRPHAPDRISLAREDRGMRGRPTMPFPTARCGARGRGRMFIRPHRISEDKHFSEFSFEFNDAAFAPGSQKLHRKSARDQRKMNKDKHFVPRADHVFRSFRRKPESLGQCPRSRPAPGPTDLAMARSGIGGNYEGCAHGQPCHPHARGGAFLSQQGLGMRAEPRRAIPSARDIGCQGRVTWAPAPWSSCGLRFSGTARPWRVRPSLP